MTLIAKAAAVLGILLIAPFALAQESSITFPIDELGGCTSKEECKTYCDIPSNLEACMTFAEAHGLMPAEEVKRVREFAALVRNQGGPGGCTSPTECRTYCSQEGRFAECRAFAEEHNLERPGDDFNREEPRLDENKAAQAIEQYGGPGGCTSMEACRTFCETEGNHDTCFAYAQEHGLMSAQDIERAKTLIDNEGPGGCRGEECRVYCEDPAHREECFAFAREHRFITEEEAERAEQFHTIIEQGGPGGCRGEECRAYCGNSAHREECMAFAREHGFGPPQEFEQGQQEVGESPYPEFREIPPPGDIPPEMQQEYEERMRMMQEYREGSYPMPPEGQYPPPEGYPPQDQDMRQFEGQQYREQMHQMEQYRTEQYEEPMMPEGADMGATVIQALQLFFNLNWRP